MGCNRRTGALQPQVIPKLVPFLAQMLGGAIDDFRNASRSPRCAAVSSSESWSSAETPAHLAPTRAAGRHPRGSGLGRDAGTARIVDTEQRRHVEPIHPKRRAGGGVVADLQRIGDIECPHLLNI